MDWKMPEMDGYTATRRIRQCKQYDDLPILAMTANAMAGDREKSLEVGMHDHIAKPINVKNMFAILAKWITLAEPAIPRMESVAVHDDYDPPLLDIEGLDTEAGLYIAQGKRRLYQKLLTKFRDSQRDFTRRFHEARISDNVDAAKRYAHTLKGDAGNLGATAVQEAAHNLEQLCAANENGDAIERQLGIVEKQLTPLLSALDGLSTPDSDVKQVVSGSNGADKGDLTPMLKELHVLLHDSDTAALDVLDRLSSFPGMSRHEVRLKKYRIILMSMILTQR